MRKIFVFMTLLIITAFSNVYSVQFVISKGKPVTGNNYYSTATYQNLTDGNKEPTWSTAWNSGSTSGWAQIDLNETVVLSKAVFYTWTNPASPETLKLYLNGNLSITKNINVPKEIVTAVEFDFTDQAARYVKIDLSASNSWVGGPEFEVYIDRAQEWGYIWNAKSAFSKNWTIAQTDSLYNVYSSTHTSYKPSSDSDTWYYISESFNEKGFWGMEHNIGESWTDKYGYKHVNIDNNGYGLSTYDKQDEWGYIAKAGYSSLFAEQFGQDWNKSEVDALYDFWLAGQNGTNAPYIEIDGMLWYFTTNNIDGRNIGDYWVDSYGNRTIYLGSSLTTYVVPEPSSVILVLLAVAGLIRRKKSYSDI